MIWLFICKKLNKINELNINNIDKIQFEGIKLNEIWPILLIIVEIKEANSS